MRDILEDKPNLVAEKTSETGSMSQKKTQSKSMLATYTRSQDLSSKSRQVMSATSQHSHTSKPDVLSVDDELALILRDSYEHLSTGPPVKPRPMSAIVYGDRYRVEDRNRALHHTLRQNHSATGKRLEFSGRDEVNVFDKLIDVLDDVLMEPDKDETGGTKESKNETTQVEQKPYKPKPFTKYVKMQDPQKLAKTRDRR